MLSTSMNHSKGMESAKRGSLVSLTRSSVESDAEGKGLRGMEGESGRCSMMIYSRDEFYI